MCTQSLCKTSTKLCTVTFLRGIAVTVKLFLSNNQLGSYIEDLI